MGLHSDLLMDFDWEKETDSERLTDLRTEKSTAIKMARYSEKKRVKGSCLVTLMVTQKEMRMDFLMVITRD